MRLNLQKLSVPQATRVLNSTAIGEVASPRLLYRHLNRGGLKVGDGRTIHVVRYTAWLSSLRKRPAGAPEPETKGGYAKKRDSAARASRDQSLSGRDILPLGFIHDPVDPARKDRSIMSFRSFCEEYFPEVFSIEWSEDHLRVIAKIERAVLEGELFAMAMPRGSGKTSLCEAACIWALLIGAHEFVMLIGADEEHAAEMLDSIKSELENNDLLDEDWSEVTGPIRALEGIHQRAKGQLYGGQRTHMNWSADEIILPTIPGSMASGGVIRVSGITGRVRGQKYKRPDGRSARPSLVLLDDPQTDTSAKSPSQCATREAILSGAILGLAGPRKKIAGLMTLTVVAPDDMADRMLDRTKHPSWQGERTRMVYEFPTAESKWAKYFDLRRLGQAEDRGTKEADDFYAQDQEAMDAGARVAWPQRKNPDELTAIQHAMNIRCDRGDAAFFAEYQNQPLPVITNHSMVLSRDSLEQRTAGFERGIVPNGTAHLTCFIDVQKTLLYWMVCAWQPDFTGGVIDYGTYPDQGRGYFTLRDAQRTMQSVHKETAFEANLYAALNACVTSIVGAEYRMGDGTALRIDKGLIDANWGQSTDIVYQVCRTHSLASILVPSHGRFVGARSTPFADWRKKPGDRIGTNWRVPGVAGQRSVRHVTYDTNYWKSFAAARLQTSMGEPGCLTFFKSRDHAMLVDHLLAEGPVRTEAQGRIVDEWKTKAVGQDNHLWDALVGNCVGASMLGVRTVGVEGNARPKRRWGVDRASGAA
jgi:hypothetical protein